MMSFCFCRFIFANFSIFFLRFFFCCYRFFWPFIGTRYVRVNSKKKPLRLNQHFECPNFIWWYISQNGRDNSETFTHSWTSQYCQEILRIKLCKKFGFMHNNLEFIFFQLKKLTTMALQMIHRSIGFNLYPLNLVRNSTRDCATFENEITGKYNFTFSSHIYLLPKKKGHIALHMSVGLPFLYNGLLKYALAKKLQTK